MDRHDARNGRENENGRTKAAHPRDVVRMERPNGKGQCCLFPHPGADSHYRIRAATQGRRAYSTHPHYLPGPRQRLRGQVVETMSARLIRLWLLLGLVMPPFGAMAHRLDEYLQATLVTIEPREVRLQINLTPGVDVADHVLPLIDRDHDGTISTNEAVAYSESLRRQITLRVDGHKVPLKLTSFNFPEPADLRTGWGIIQIEFTGI